MSKNNHKGKKIISKLITILCLVLFIYAGYGLFDIGMDYYKNRKMMHNIQDTFYQEVSNEKEELNTAQSSKEMTEVRPGFESLQEINEDIVGWITINDTQIDYPVLQSDDNLQYLDTNYDNKLSRAGSIFLDYRNQVEDFDRNVIVYGHRMKDGSMFQHLSKFMDEEFFENHRTFQFDTLYNRYEAEVFAVYNTLTDFNYIQTDFENDEEYEQLLEDIKNESRYDTDIQVEKDDRIITLSTCDYELDQEKGRLVVQAKLTEI
ncbi:MAG TPA: class B sortase [Pseudogracilibacillus sp.]|nr:class B sortase [Pseudogracilibacillus sp.]